MFLLQKIPELSQFEQFAGRIYRLRNKVDHDDTFLVGRESLAELIRSAETLEQFVSQQVEPKIIEGIVFSSLQDTFMNEHDQMKGWAIEVESIAKTLGAGYEDFQPKVEFYDKCYENVDNLSEGELVAYMLDMRELSAELRHTYDSITTELDAMAAEADAEMYAGR